MKLSTVVPITPLNPQLDYESSILCLGSCFAENIGGKLLYYGFDTVSNPFGIIFNPVSIALLLEKMVEGDRFRESGTLHLTLLTKYDLIPVCHIYPVTGFW